MDLNTYLTLLRNGNQIESTNPTATLQFLIQAQTALENNKMLPINITHHQHIIEQRIAYLKRVATKITTKPKKVPIDSPKKAISAFTPPTLGPSPFAPPSISKPKPSIQDQYAWVLMQWDERGGPQRLSAYPANAKVGLNDFMQIYANHIAENERGMLAMDVKGKTFTSYYSGAEKNLFIILISPGGQDPDQFEKGLEQNMNLIEKRNDDLEFPESEAQQYFNQIIPKPV
jgi:hypothetical protein